MIEHTTELTGVEAFPELDGKSNVIKIVRWVIKFFDTDHPEAVSAAGMETLLDTSDLTGFQPFDQLTKAEVLTWAESVADLPTLVAELQPFHEARLPYVIETHGTVPVELQP